MIQRIQTVFLLLCVAGFGLLYAFPFAATDIPGKQMLADSLFTIQDNIILMVIAGLGALLALISIFRYNNRPLQIKLNYLVVAIALAFLLAGGWLFTQEGDDWLSKVQVTFKAGAFLPVGVAIFAVIANIYIQKDHKKVRSAYDRLR